MAKAEDDIPDFNEIDLFGEDSDSTEPLDDLAAGAEANVAPAEEEADDLASEAAMEDELGELEAEAAEEEQVEETPEPEEEEDGQKKRGLLQALTEASPYTVMLALALLALLIAAYCLFMEWQSYDRQTKPEKIQQAAVRAAIDFSPEFQEKVSA